MLSYKEYKQLNESLYGTNVLGLARPTTLGVVGTALEEGKAKKKMDAGDLEDAEDAPEEEVPDEEGGEEEVVDDTEDTGDCGDMKFCKKGMKKKAKKNMKAEAAAPCVCGQQNCTCGGLTKRQQMTDEEMNWWSSVHNMLDFNPTAKNWDGISVQEDSLLSPPVEDGLVYKQPQPGEAGFAPQGKLSAAEAKFADEWGFECDKHTPADPGWKYNS